MGAAGCLGRRAVQPVAGLGPTDAGQAEQLLPVFAMVSVGHFRRDGKHQQFEGDMEKFKIPARLRIGDGSTSVPAVVIVAKPVESLHVPGAKAAEQSGQLVVGIFGVGRKMQAAGKRGKQHFQVEQPVVIAVIKTIDEAREKLPLRRLPTKSKVAAGDRVDRLAETKAEAVDVVELVRKGNLDQVDRDLPVLAESTTGVVANMLFQETGEFVAHGTYFLIFEGHTKIV